MKDIIDYLCKEYDPEGIIVYGSFADGSNSMKSDFDALLIANSAKRSHDNTVIAGTELDVFIYLPERFMNEYNPADFIQIFDGSIIFDQTGILTKLKQDVAAYIANKTGKSKEEIQTGIEWCRKMLLRTGRKDAEGYYRWHWLLVDSLELYSDIYYAFYPGPKKALRRMQETDQEAFEVYRGALMHMDQAALNQWIRLLQDRVQ